MAQRLQFKEGVAQPVSDRGLRAGMSSAADRLRQDLRPRLAQFAADGELVQFQNLVGSLSLADGSVVEVAPKVDVQEWTTAVVELLEPDTRISVTGSQRSSPSTRANDLTTALALEYARRLERAIRADGPVHIYERRHLATRRLAGHLDVTRWVRGAQIDPTRFPVSRDELTDENDFTRGLAIVAGLLGRAAVGAELSTRLRRLQAAVILGHAIPTYVNPAVGGRNLPMQWARYRPAWDIAAPLLRRRSPVGDPSRSMGLEVAIEPWPLLETVLTRALKAMGFADPAFRPVPKSRYPLLLRNGGTALNVEPDGVIHRDGSLAATIECKYTVPGPTPAENHVHQALATAAAMRSPLSVLIYPGSQQPRTYETAGFRGRPAALVTVGLRLFEYRSGAGDAERAVLLRSLVDQASGGGTTTAAS